jgi:predicted secreted Zn-dependent protease
MFASIRRSRPEPTLVRANARRLLSAQICAASTLFLLGMWLCVTQYPALASALPEHSAHALPCTKTPVQQPTRPLSPINVQPGLELTVEPIHTYQVQGTDTEQIRAQLARCSPISAFSADTSYSIDTHYSYYVNTDGQCSISDATVGLHISQTLPQWQASTATSPKTSQQWNTYLAHLTTHENGHAALDVQYARQLAATLQSFSAPNCNHAGQRITSLVTAKINQLNIANNRYDAQTNHGATQGAILR